MTALLGALVVASLWQGAVIGACVVLLRPWLSRWSAADRCRMYQLALAAFPMATGLSSYVHTSPSVSVGHAPPTPGWLVVVGWLWFAGALAGLMRLGAGIAWTRWLRASAAEVPAWLQQRLETLAREMDLSFTPAMGLSDRVAGPCVVGVLRPMVLVPGSLLLGLEPEQLELLLRHELAHLRRLDPLTNAIQATIEALYFFHPVAWWLSRQIHVERELATDALAVHDRRDRLTLARALARLAETSPGAHALGSSTGPLMHRIQTLIDPPPSASRRPRLLPALVVAATCIATFAFACDGDPDEAEVLAERAAPYAEIVSDAADEHRVPEALLWAMIGVESDFNPDAVSPSGAQGLMQLMPSTAESVGVEDPLEPRQNVMGGAAYLRRMLDQFDDDLTLAVAAYNAGPRAVAEHMSVPDNGETPQYVARVLADFSRLERE